MPFCKKCDESYSRKRAELGYKTCVNCGSPKQEFLAIPVAKSNYIVGFPKDLLNNNHKGIIYLTPSHDEGIYLLVNGDCPRRTRS
jgi:hypothetical protein